MKLSKKIKNIFLYTFVLSMILATMSGCVYSNNKKWDDMTSEEQEEARQTYEATKSDLEDEFSGDELEYKFVRYILNKVEQGIEYKD